MENSERAAVIIKVKLNLSAYVRATYGVRFNVSRKISSRMIIPEDNTALYEFYSYDKNDTTFSIRSIFRVNYFTAEVPVITVGT